MIRERGHKEMQQQLPQTGPSALAGARPGRAGLQAPGLAVRLGLLCLVPAPAALLGLARPQLLLCLGAAGFWLALELGLAHSAPAAAGCRATPFGIRLLGAFCLNLCLCWLLTTWDAAEGPGPAPGPLGEPGEPGRVDTLSVVLPCANESDFVWRTIKSVYDATPRDRLREIIVVDDASEPPVAAELASDFLQAHRATVLRQETPQGLIRSKKRGGDAARGDAIVFLDCHVKPMEAWTEPILRNLRENPRRVVVPSITALDIDTWEEISDFGGGTKMCLTWNADFVWCSEYPGPYVPIMSGGLLAMTRSWWELSGGYDDQMLSWGGENLDQSLRTWLCGGEIMVAEGSRVAHMWRDPAKPKTTLRYSIPTDHVRRNRLRAAQAWLGGWAEKVRSFPEFEDFGKGGPLHVGSLANVEEFRERLQCKGFDWYLHRFRDLYVGTGRLPRSVFHLREAHSRLCLHHEMASGGRVGGRFVLSPCSRDSELQRFHEANARDDGNCCSGMKLWDFNACLAAYELGGSLNANECETFGGAPAQHVALSETGELRWSVGAQPEENGCLVPRSAGEHTATATKPAVLHEGLRCASRVEHVEAEGGDAFRVAAGGLCLAADGAADYGAQLAFAPCSPGARDQNFWRTHNFGDGRHQVMTSEGLCIDAKHGEGPLITWPCDAVELGNTNQLYDTQVGEAFVWKTGGTADPFCADPSNSVLFAPCAAPEGEVPPGQRFQRAEVREDGSFELRPGGADLCLAHAARDVPGQEEGPRHVLVAEPCNGQWSQRWEYTDGRLRSADLFFCVDANDMDTPVLYQCYSPEDKIMTQQFELHENGWVQLPRSWADNGRIRYAAKCLDAHRAPPQEVVTMPCDEAQLRGALWERLWEETPLETRLFQEAEEARQGREGGAAA